MKNTLLHCVSSVRQTSFKFLTRSITLLMLLALGSSSLWATDVTFTAGTDVSSTSSLTKSGVSISMSTLSRDDNYRANSGTDLTVSSASSITKIVFNCTGSGTSNYSPSKMNIKSGSSGSYSCSGKVGTWTGNATSVTFSTTAQVRMTSIVVTVAGSSKYTVTLSRNGVTQQIKDLTSEYTLPTTGEADACTDWKFKGWSESTVTSTTTAPSYITKVSSEKTVYAVYGKTESGGGGTGPSAGTVLWKENFKDCSSLPSTNCAGTTTYNDATISYSYGNGGGTTAIYDDNLAGGTTPEILIAKSSGSMTISGIPTAGASKMTLTFKTNQTGSLSVTSGTSGVSVGSLSISSKTATCDINITGSIASFNLTITKTGSGNSREDDFSLVVAGGGSTSTTTYTTSPECKTLSSIAVTTPPTKTTYTEGETFDPAGMVVTATYTDHTTAPITGYTYSPTDALTVGTTSITISYGGKTTTQSITVNAIPTRTINWLVNNSSVKSESKKEGVKLNTLDMPPAPADDALVCANKFMGWSRTNLGSALEQEAPDDLFTDITKFPDTELVGSTDITFYAVFASSGGAGASSSITSFAKGDYLLIDTYGSKYYAMSGSGKSVTGVDISSAVTQNADGTISVDASKSIITDAMLYTIGGTASAATVCNIEDGKYVQGGSSTDFTQSTSNAWTVTENSDRFTFVYTSESRCILYKDGTGFKNYATSNRGGSGYGTGYLYLAPATGYEDYVTSCGKSLSISPKSLTAERPNSGTGTLTATANLYTPTDGYTWTSDNESVATVSGSGATATVTYKNSGTCTITCSAPDGSTPMTATATVTVPQGYSVEYVDGGSSTFVRDLIPGDKYTLPTGSMGCEGYTFLGWVTSSFSDGTTTKPSPILSGPKTMLAENVTYYAVYEFTEEASGEGGTETFDFAAIANAKGWVNDNAYTSVSQGAVTITAVGGGNNGKYYTSDQTWRMYSEGEVVITSTAGDITAVSSTPTKTFTIEDGEASLSLSATTRFSRITVTYGSTATITYTNSPECCELKPVTNVQVSDLTATGCKISWTKPSPITGITKLQIINADNDEVVKDNIDANATSATLTGLTECQTYSFKVASVGSECTTYSGSVSAMPYGGAITVTFDYNGGTGEILSASTDCEHTSILLPEPETRSHAIFDGWFTQRQDGTLVGQAGDTYTPTASCTLYAHWTKDPGAEIMTWYEDGIDVMVNVGGSPSVLLMDEKTYGTEGGQNANDLFISKYFEATGNLKLLGIYNGTESDIDVSDVVISVAIGHLNSSGGVSNPDYRYFGANPSGQNGFWLKNVIPSKVIHSGEEIILYTFNPSASDDGTLKGCIEETLNTLFKDEKGLERENWYNVEPTTASNGYLNWSGSQSIMLAHSDGDKLTPIDIFGGYSIDYGEYKTSSESGAVLQYTKGKTSFDVMKHDGTTAIDTYDGDGPSYLAYGQNYNDQEGPEIVIGTNRILLIRKNTVVDGSNALDKNLDKGFMTLGEEWMGAPVGAGSGTEAADNVCANFSAVAQYDYSMYYKTFETIMEQTQLDAFDLNDDGTYHIPIDTLYKLSCSRMKLQVFANSTDKKPVAESMYYVPIFVSDANHATNETLFTKYTDKVCRTCNVVVSNGYTLTVASNAAGGIDTIGNIYVYENSKFVAENPLVANSISFRSRQDEVASGDLLNNNILVGHKKNTQTKVYFTKFISDDDWHWITVPYAVNIEEVTFSDSSECVYGQDWYLKYYDGEARADNPKQADGRNWKLVDKNTTPQLLPGVGYIVAINDQPSTTLNSKTVHKWRELSFPMAGYDETSNKDVAVRAYGAGDEYATVTPNHKGWNLVGNPYISYYNNEDLGTPLQMGKLNPIDDGSGGITYESKGELYYVTIPNSAGRAGYHQELISATQLPPFTSYFVQIAGTTKNEENVVRFLASYRKTSASAPLRRNMAEEEEEIELPTFIGVNLSNSLGEMDNTGLCILDAYTQSTYEVGADLGKWIGSKYSSYTQPILYSTAHSDKLAFNALSEEEAKQNMAVSLGCVLLQSGTYTFSLNRDYDLSRVESVFLYDALTNTNTDLTKSDYTFSGSAANKEINDRFYLSAVLREKVDVVTGLGMKTFGDDAIIKFITPDGQLHVARKGVIYDAQGRIEQVIR